MRYRRNADVKLRDLERAYQANPCFTTLLPYNHERIRHGELPLVAPIEYLQNMNLGPTFWGEPIDRIQFPGAMLKKNPLDDTYPVNPTPEDCESFDVALRQVIPTLIGLGWIALIQQCGNVYLRIKKKPETGEYVVYWMENGRKNEDKSHFANDKEDAEATMREMQRHIPKLQYPVLYTLPRSILEPSGDPINLPPAQQHYRLIADQWMRYEDPRSLTDPTIRPGGYPTKLILVERRIPPGPRRRPREKTADLTRFGMWYYTVPYDGPHVGTPYLSSGDHGLTQEAARLTYVVKLLKLSTACHYQLFEK